MKRIRFRIVLIVAIVSVWTVAMGLVVPGCGSGDGTSQSSFEKQRQSSGNTKQGYAGGDRTRLSNSARSIQGNPPELLQVDDSGIRQLESLTISGVVTLQPVGSDDSLQNAGASDVVLKNGPVVATNLTGEILATATTDENGRYFLEVPMGEDNVIVTATENNLTLKTAVTQVPDETANINADSTTVTAYGEEEITNTGNTQIFSRLIELLNIQVNRETSLLKEMSQAHQAIVDTMSGSRRTLAFHSRQDLRTVRGEKASWFVRVTQSVFDFLAEKLIQPVSAQDGVQSYSLFQEFIRGNFTGSETVLFVTRSLNTNRDRVVAVGKVINIIGKTLSKLDQNRSNLTPDQAQSIENALDAGMDAVKVVDDPNDALTAVAFVSFISHAFYPTVNANLTGEVNDSALSSSMLSTLDDLSQTVNNAVSDSQDPMSPTLFSQKLNFGSMVNDLTSHVSRNLQNQGLEDQTIGNEVEEVFIGVGNDLIETSGSGAESVQNQMLQSIEDGLNNVGLNPSTVNEVVAQVRANTQQTVEEIRAEAQLQNTSTTTTRRSTTTSKSTTTKSSTTTSSTTSSTTTIMQDYR